MTSSRVLVLVCCVAALVAATSGGRAVAAPRLYENKIKEALQRLLTDLRENGVPSLGLASLDPLTYDRLEVAFDNATLATLSLNVTNVNVSGLTRVDVPELTFKLIGLQFTYTLTWPVVQGKCSYELVADVHIMPMKQWWGSGPFSFTANNFSITGGGKLSLKGLQHLHLDSFTIAASLAQLNADVEGVLGDPVFSDFVSKAISVAGPGLLDEFHQEITAYISPVIMEQANKILENVTIGEIIGYYDFNIQPIKLPNYV